MEGEEGREGGRVCDPFPRLQVVEVVYEPEITDGAVFTEGLDIEPLALTGPEFTGYAATSLAGQALLRKEGLVCEVTD